MVQVVLRDQHVDVARLQRGEAVLRGQRDELHLGRIVEDRRRERAADSRRRGRSSCPARPAGRSRARLPLAPQLSMPRDLMVLSVWADAAEAATAIAAARASVVTARFMGLLSPG